MSKFDFSYGTENNSYVQLFATLCVFQPLLRDHESIASSLTTSATSRYLHITFLNICRHLQRLPSTDSLRGTLLLQADVLG